MGTTTGSRQRQARTPDCIVALMGLLLLLGSPGLMGQAWGSGGVLLWDDQFDKSEGFDQARAIATDGKRVVAAGFGTNAAGNPDFLVRAYDGVKDD